MTRSIRVVKDVLYNTRNSVSSTMRPSKAVLKIREEIFGICELLHFLEYDILSNLKDRGRMADAVR